MRWKSALVILSLCVPQFAFAQMDEIIVTGSRITSSSHSQPHIVMKRRADNLVLSVSVINDTRNTVDRLKELETTMEAVVKTSARMPEVELGLLIEREDDDGNDIQFIRPYDQSKFGDYVTGGFRADTSAINLVLKTKVVDTYTNEEDAMAVLEGFMNAVKTTGRTEVIDTEDPVLSIISPSQYRYEIIDDIAKDANRIASSFGPDYRVAVDGLEAPIVFYQTGELELTLYIPYGFSVAAPQ